MNTEVKILNKLLENLISQCIRRKIHRDQVEFIQGTQNLLNIRKSMNIIYNLNCAKEKKSHDYLYGY